ncbi:MAG: hypothetical protein HKN60_05515, partial [Rhizobiales bacterium]|nr:hypothetical protein [Hyphomicrobiales bacterium]
FEATRLAGFAEPEAAQIFGRPRGLNPDVLQGKNLLKPWPARKAEKAYLDRFEARSATVPIQTDAKLL